MNESDRLRTLRTVENGRLLWWREEADDEYWRRRFEPTIVQSHQAASADRLGHLGDILSRRLPREGKILEAGCGTGWLVAGLRNRGFDIEGVEASLALVSEVRKRFPDLPIRQGDVTALDVPDGHYQGYVSLGVIEHFRDGCDHFLHEACRLVASGGTLCIAVPHFNAVRRVKGLLGAYSTPPRDLPFYQYGFTRKDLLRLFDDQPVDVVAFAGYGSARAMVEELPKSYERVFRMPLLWRLPQLFDSLDWTRLGTHMIMAVLRRR